MATAIATKRTREHVIGAPVGVEVIGTGHTRDGRRCWCVPSTRDPHVWYIVVEASGQRPLWCSCPAGRYGKACVHKSAVTLRRIRDVREALEHEHQMSSLEHEAVMGRLPDDEPRYMLTEAGRRALHATESEWDPRETAIPGYRADNRAFSIFK